MVLALFVESFAVFHQSFDSLVGYIPDSSVLDRGFRKTIVEQLASGMEVLDDLSHGQRQPELSLNVPVFLRYLVLVLGEEVDQKIQLIKSIHEFNLLLEAMLFDRRVQCGLGQE